MKLNRESSSGVTLIDAYDENSVTVGGVEYRSALIVQPSGEILSWALAGNGLSAEGVAVLAQHKPAVVLIGTGVKQRFPHPSVLRALIEARIGYEVMDTGSACRTYNLLAAEGRKVLAALIPGAAA